MCVSVHIPYLHPSFFVHFEFGVLSPYDLSSTVPGTWEDAEIACIEAFLGTHAMAICGVLAHRNMIWLCDEGEPVVGAVHVQSLADLSGTELETEQSLKILKDGISSCVQQCPPVKGVRTTGRCGQCNNYSEEHGMWLVPQHFVSKCAISKVFSQVFSIDLSRSAWCCLQLLDKAAASLLDCHDDMLPLSDK